LFPYAGITRIRLLLTDNKQRVCSQPAGVQMEINQIVNRNSKSKILQGTPV
jgi:hypothetical protein